MTNKKNKNTASDTQDSKKKEQTATEKVGYAILSLVLSILFFTIYLGIGLWMCYMKIVWKDAVNAKLSRNDFMEYVGLNKQQPGFLQAAIDLVSVLTPHSTSNSGPISTCSSSSSGKSCNQVETVPSLKYSTDDKTFYKHLYNDNHTFIRDELMKYNCSSSLERIAIYQLLEIYYVIYSCSYLVYEMQIPDIIMIVFGPILLFFLTTVSNIITFFMFPISIFRGLYNDWHLSSYFMTFVAVIGLLIFGAIFFPVLNLYFFIKAVRSMWIPVKEYTGSGESATIASSISKNLSDLSDKASGLINKAKDAISSATDSVTPSTTDTTPPTPTQQQQQPIQGVETSSPTTTSTQGGATSTIPEKSYTFGSYCKDTVITNGWFQYYLMGIIILQLFSISNILGLCFLCITVLFMIYMLIKYNRIFFKAYDAEKAELHHWLPIETPIVISKSSASGLKDMAKDMAKNAASAIGNAFLNKNSLIKKL
jgi:hypothetical protein